MHSDQTRKYDISDTSPILRHSWQQSHNKGLYYGFRDDLLSRLVIMYQAPGTSCGILYYPGLVSCPF